MRNNLFNNKLTPVFTYYSDLSAVGSFCKVGNKGPILPLMIDLNTQKYAVDLTESIVYSDFRSVDEYLESDEFLDFLIDVKTIFEDFLQFEIQEYNNRFMLCPNGFFIDNEKIINKMNRINTEIYI